jgi:hypothetical protein
MAGTSNAQASRARVRLRASASEPEENKSSDAAFTRSMKARIESSVALSEESADAPSQTRATKNVQMKRAPGRLNLDLSQITLKDAAIGLNTW